MMVAERVEIIATNVQYGNHVGPAADAVRPRSPGHRAVRSGRREDLLGCRVVKHQAFCDGSTAREGDKKCNREAQNDMVADGNRFHASVACCRGAESFNSI